MAIFLIAAAPLPAKEEARAQALFHQLRCVVCKGESVAESSAEVAADIRAMVRTRIEAGDSDEQITQTLVSTYGTQVLMRPPLARGTLPLWLAPLLLLAMGGGLLFAYFKPARASA